ncbi:MAG: TrkH family potassium uptake protein [Lachnospiraceae bacterium]|nr:TrkH family potassium uptake protein [Lachnospiraceae bacterium]
MNFKMIRYLIGWILKIVAGFMAVPIITSIIYKEKVGLVYLGCALLYAFIGALLSIKKVSNTNFFAKDGFVAVTLSWLVLGVIGALPFFISGEIPHLVDAIFESFSGFTTTGATILTDVEALSHTALMWRSFTHFIGGMGVLVFFLAILPSTGGQNMLLMKSESTGPSVGKLVPRIQDSAVYLYIIYVALTLIELVLLICFGMPVFDAICTAAGTAGTGGFGVKNASIGAYAPSLQIIVTVFMILFSFCFTFYFLILMRRVKEAFAMEEIKYFVLIIVVAIALVTFDIRNLYSSFGEALNLSSFQVASLMSSTGFTTTDYEKWPAFSQFLLVMVSCIGACAGSTGGGIKVSRIVIYMRSIRLELERFIHPRSIRTLTMDKKAVPKDVMRQTNVYIMCYVVIACLTGLIVSLDGFDFTTNLTSVLTTLNNTGPGLSVCGPSRNFSEFSYLSKVVLTWNMLVGRLEIYPVLIFFMPSTWRRK